MIQYNNYVIADAGKCFYKDKQKYPCFIKKEGVLEDFIERNIEKISYDGKYLMITPVISLECPSVDKIKEVFIKYIFSNDEQIAIMLNYQDSKTTQHKEVYNVMQDWRNWISEQIKNLKDNGTQNT